MLQYIIYVFVVTNDDLGVFLHLQVRASMGPPGNWTRPDSWPGGQLKIRRSSDWSNAVSFLMFFVI